MKNQNFTASFTVDETPDQVFNAINNVRGWWSQAIEGDTDKLGAEFKYHYQDIHRCAFKITEFAPGKKVVWHVLDNYFSFVKDKSEWKGTNVVFEIAKKGDKTEVHFTHVGLLPAYECYDVCSEAWGSYITGSLRNLITTGNGQPNPIEEVVSKARQMSNQNFTSTILVDRPPEEVFAAVNNVRGWWTGEPGIEGGTDKLGDEFTYRYEPHHYSKQKITELIPDKKIVWTVLDSKLNFVEDKREWTGTKITFEIAKKGRQTELRFTHVGLAPEVECYDACSNAWGSYINGSLLKLITKGKGQPNQKAQKQTPKGTMLAQI
jgi:uncharacterized protein YndB with AHSA1/START domain